MSERSRIGWTDGTFNIAWGCTKIGPGCKHCYAAVYSTFRGFPGLWEPNGERRVFGEKHWREPLKWVKKWAAENHGRRMRIFTSSMCDVFEDHPIIDAEREKLWPLIRATPEVDWQILTKRVDRMAKLLPLDLPNVWAGASISNQADADEMLPKLLNVRAPLLFVSFEPAIEVVDFDQPQCQFHGREEVGSDEKTGEEFCNECALDGSGGELSNGWFLDPLNGGIAWVIVGGESGSGHRDLPVGVVPSIIKQCRAAGVPVFVKQDSGAKPGKQGRILDEDFVQEFPR